MNLELVYPNQLPVNFEQLQAIPNKNSQHSGYYLIALVRSALKTAIASTTIDRYVCFTNTTRDQVWIEKLGIIRARAWFAFEDTRSIEDNEEWNEVYNFLKINKILD